jgi:hypothetical protein
MHRLRVFENRVLKKIFGPKREELRGTLISGFRRDVDEICGLLG